MAQVMAATEAVFATLGYSTGHETSAVLSESGHVPASTLWHHEHGRPTRRAVAALKQYLTPSEEGIRFRNVLSRNAPFPESISLQNLAYLLMIRILVSHVWPQILFSCETRLRPFVGLAVCHRTFVSSVGMAFCEMALDSSGQKVVTVGDHFVVKLGVAVKQIEGENLLFVERNLSIAAPLLYSMYRNTENNKLYIIMELLSGATLGSAWPCFDEQKKLAITSQLSVILAQARDRDFKA